MIVYDSRYSTTDEFDDLGRWARIAYFKNIQIAWINKLRNKETIIFSVTLFFPTSGSDMPNEYKACYTLEECKAWIEERWNYFIKRIEDES